MSKQQRGQTPTRIQQTSKREAPAQVDPLIGRVLGGCRIERLLGMGGMAVVYKAFQERLGRDVALKVLPPMLAADAQFSERFRREALAVARLRHSNITQIFDTGEEGGYRYIIMEYLEGGALTERMKNGPLPAADCLSIIAPLAGALDEAHRQGIIHRDIKPANILFTKNGQPVLSDFGIARIFETGTVTSTGLFVGTPEYVSPEQVEGQPVDARSDVYSLGIVLYQMLTGRVPFQGATPTAVLHAHVYTEPPSMRQFKPDVTPEVEAVVQRALRKNPAERFATACELVDALQAALKGVMPAPVAIKTRTTPPPHPVVKPPLVAPEQQRLLLRLAGPVLALFLLALVVAALSGGDGGAGTPANRTPVATLVSARGDAAGAAVLGGTSAATATPVGGRPALQSSPPAAPPTFTPVPTFTPWPTPVAGPTFTPWPTMTPWPTGTPYATLTPDATSTAWPTGTAYPTLTPVATATLWPTWTPVPSPTPWPTATYTPQPTKTYTPRPTNTFTPRPANTFTATPTRELAAGIVIEHCTAAVTWYCFSSNECRCWAAFSGTVRNVGEAPLTNCSISENVWGKNASGFNLNPGEARRLNDSGAPPGATSVRFSASCTKPNGERISASYDKHIDSGDARCPRN